MFKSALLIALVSILAILPFFANAQSSPEPNDLLDQVIGSRLHHFQCELLLNRLRPDSTTTRLLPVLPIELGVISLSPPPSDRYQSRYRSDAFEAGQPQARAIFESEEDTLLNEASYHIDTIQARNAAETILHHLISAGPLAERALKQLDELFPTFPARPRPGNFVIDLIPEEEFFDADPSVNRETLMIRIPEFPGEKLTLTITGDGIANRILEFGQIEQEMIRLGAQPDIGIAQVVWGSQSETELSVIVNRLSRRLHGRDLLPPDHLQKLEAGFTAFAQKVPTRDGQATIQPILFVTTPSGGLIEVTIWGSRLGSVQMKGYGNHNGAIANLYPVHHEGLPAVTHSELNWLSDLLVEALPR